MRTEPGGFASRFQRHLGPAKGQQPAIEARNPLVDVGKRHRHGGSLAVQLGNGDELARDQHFEIVAQRHDFVPGPRHKAPVAGPCVVENLETMMSRSRDRFFLSSGRMRMFFAAIAF